MIKKLLVITTLGLVGTVFPNSIKAWDADINVAGTVVGPTQVALRAHNCPGCEVGTVYEPPQGIGCTQTWPLNIGPIHVYGTGNCSTDIKFDLYDIVYRPLFGSYPWFVWTGVSVSDATGGSFCHLNPPHGTGTYNFGQLSGNPCQ